MKDEGLIADQTLSPSQAAVQYLLQRIQVDANLRWYMLGTEAFALLCNAYAQRCGKSVDDVKKHFSQPAVHRSSDSPEVVDQRKALEQIEKIISESRDRYQDNERLRAMLVQIDRIAQRRRPIGGAR
jgi:hypothetical protein